MPAAAGRWTGSDLHGGRCATDVEHDVSMPGIDRAAPDRTDTSSG
jgi:hypothetical protein